MEDIGVGLENPFLLLLGIFSFPSPTSPGCIYFVVSTPQGYTGMIS